MNDYTEIMAREAAEDAEAAERKIAREVTYYVGEGEHADIAVENVADMYGWTEENVWNAYYAYRGTK